LARVIDGTSQIASQFWTSDFNAAVRGNHARVKGAAPMIIVDASAAVAVILSEPRSQVACDAMTNEDLLHAPSLLIYEVTNALATSVHNDRIGESQSRLAAAQFAALPWSFETHSGALRIEAILDIAHRHSLTAYDASYLELAVRCSCPLLSLDAELRSAAKKEGVSVLPIRLAVQA
jgi:predicted nucleic acid-binding protein